MPTRDRLILISISDAVNKILIYSNPYKDADHFYNDEKSFDAVMMNFIIIGEMVQRLSDEFKSMHREIEWPKIWKFRNIIAHDYFGIDAEEVWQIIQSHIPELKGDIENILASKE
jgi:uncharacterized protein with HEPN domain